ncbi:hypothetical protein [Sphingosinicella sp. YJ22]|uniref:hypothetical protein n=1 Tax=Sphingosinicella sp. YJ22 TaxID=1104780 RepID=UPI00140DD514|nr:hypothetical protein [Sphingosinicella sp. YJ22]
MDDQPPPYTSSNFHDDVQHHLVTAAVEALSQTKLEWHQVAPLLKAARAMCGDDIRAARVALHGLEYEGAELVPADEAYLSMNVRDREDGSEWLSQTWWLSDIALADEDPERIRCVISAMERSIDKLKEWLSAKDEAADKAETPPTPSD